MDYRMSQNYEEEILRLNERVKKLMAYSEKGNYMTHDSPNPW